MRNKTQQSIAIFLVMVGAVMTLAIGAVIFAHLTARVDGSATQLQDPFGEWASEPEQTPADPVAVTLPDCEENGPETLPCGTYDDGALRVVHDFDPYTYVAVVRCSAEDGGTVTPCLFPADGSEKGWLYYTG